MIAVIFEFTPVEGRFADYKALADGDYRDAAGQRAVVAGETTIYHESATWRFEAVLRLRGDRPALQHNRYEIEPFAPGARSTHWTSTHQALGTLRGRFVLTGDA